MTDPRPEHLPPARFRRLHRPLVAVVMLLACVAVIGFFILPSFVRSQAESRLAEALGRPVAIDEVRLNPFRLSAEVRGLHVYEAEGGGEALGVDNLYANLEAISLVKRGLVLSELRVDGPRLHVARLDDSRYNWTDVIERLTAGESEEGGLPYSLNNIRLQRGELRFDDRPRGLSHEVDDLEIGIPFLSNLQVQVDVFVEPSLSARVNGDQISASGRTKPFSSDRETSLDLELDGLELGAYLSYLPFRPAFRLPSGRLTTRLALSFSQPADGTPTMALKGTVQLDDLVVEDTAGAQVLRLPEAAVELADVQPLAHKWHLSRLRLQAPEVNLVRLREGGFNVERLLPPTSHEAEPAVAARPAAPVDFLLESARLRDGRLNFTDHTVATPFHVGLDEINLDLRNLASTAGEPADLLTDFVTDGGERFSFRDRLRLTPFELEGEASVDRLQLARYAPYLATALPGGSVRGGQVDATLRYRWTTGPQGMDGELAAESLSLRDFVLALKQREAPLLKLAKAEVRDLSLRPGGRTLQVAEVGLSGVDVAVRRDAAGLDIARLTGGGEDSGTKDEGTWRVAVNRLQLEKGSLRFEDRSVGTPVKLAADDVRLAVGQFDTAGGEASVAFQGRINQRGLAKVDGSLALAPLKGDFKIDLERLDLAALQGYTLDGFNIAIAGGRLDTAGRLAVEEGKDGALKARYRGALGVSSFHAVDRQDATDFMRWRSLRAHGADVQVAPFSLSLAELAVTGLYSRLMLDEEGRLQLRSQPAAAKPEPAEEAGGGAATAELAPVDSGLPPLRIGKIALKDATIAFSDRFIRPNYDARLTGVDGVLSGLSTDPASMASVDFKGRVDDAASVAVTGELSPFRDDRYLNLTASVKDFDLPSVSTYSGKYVGYGIEKGKLSAELSYKVEQRRLTATNRVFVDQLTFGERAEGASVLSLPVHLGVALLKNRQGEIDLELPVTGSLDDPQFSVAGLVFKAFVNLIVKVVAAPFSWLGSMLGSGEELGYVDFVPGVAVIDEAMRQKLAMLARVLEERPGLSLDIVGQADPDADAEGLRRALLERELRTLKRKELIGKGEVVPADEALVVSSEDYPGLLRQLYRQASFDRPRTFFGGLKDIPVEEMEVLILAHTTVSEAELRQLAQQRAQAVRDWLVNEGKIAPERLFLVAPKLTSEGEGGGRRTQFALR